MIQRHKLRGKNLCLASKRGVTDEYIQNIWLKSYAAMYVFKIGIKTKQELLDEDKKNTYYETFYQN